MELAERVEWERRLKEPFKNLRFEDEGHKYHVIGDDRPISSVSSVLKCFYDEFDSEGVSAGYSKSRGFRQEDVLKAWEGEGLIATTHGTKVHLYGEDYLNWKYFGRGKEPVVFDKQSLGVQDFFNSLPDYMIPVCSELQMYSPKYWISGTADLIFFNKKTGKLICGDFKSNSSLTSSYNKTPLKIVDPSHGLLTDNLGKYNVQLNLYTLFLREAGFDVQTGFIVHLTEDKKERKLYKLHKVKNLQSELVEWLDTGEHLDFLYGI